MTQVTIKPSKEASIISIPEVILKTLKLNAGTCLELSIENNKIILTPIKNGLTLESILEGSPRHALEITEEDRSWLNANAVGKEM